MATNNVDNPTIHTRQVERVHGLVGEERELHELACLSGVLIDPEVFKILVDLIRLGVSPAAIVEMLKSMCSQDSRRNNRETSKENVKAKPKVVS